jgi:hypothetical protein
MGMRVSTADGTAPVTGIRTALRRTAAWLARAACIPSGASGCKSIASGMPAAVPASLAAKAPAKASADSACQQALEAARTYGPVVVQGAVEDKESLDKAEIALIVIVLNEAANPAGSSGVGYGAGTASPPSLILCPSCAPLRMGTARAPGDSGAQKQARHQQEKEMTVMHQLTQLASEAHHQRLAHAEAQRPAERLVALARATRRAERAERRMRRAARQARRLRAQLQAQITHAP